MSNKTLGDQGETCAVEYLRRQGCHILTRNYRTKLGEKIIQTAYCYLHTHHMENHLCRFDVLEIYAMKDGWKVNQIKFAFEA